MLASALLFIAASSVAIAEPKGRDGSAGDVFRFVGFTDDTVNAGFDVIDGGQGMLAMHALCQDEFSLDARMCTSKEFWLSPNAEAPLFATAWLHNERPSQLIDFTGFNDGNANCRGWTETGGTTGNVVTIDGKPAQPGSCFTARPVTCCAPAQ